jgi:hypothetical protein
MSIQQNVEILNAVTIIPTLLKRRRKQNVPKTTTASGHLLDYFHRTTHLWAAAAKAISSFHVACSTQSHSAVLNFLAFGLLEASNASIQMKPQLVTTMKEKTCHGAPAAIAIPRMVHAVLIQEVPVEENDAEPKR